MRRKNETSTDERGRWSSKKKMDAVLRLLKGEDLDTLSRELRVNAATLSCWREVFLANGLAGLRSRETDARREDQSAAEGARRNGVEPGDLEGDQPGL